MGMMDMDKMEMAGMMGMMTLIRVVSPALFEQIAERRRVQAGRAI